MPEGATRDELNQLLETYYNEDAPPNTYVPYSIWEDGGVREMPEPVYESHSGDLSAVPEATRAAVVAHLREMTGKADIQPKQDMSRDLGLDSLARTELLVWIGKEFGIEVSDATTLDTVADLMLAACGEAVSMLPRKMEPVPNQWFTPGSAERAVVSPVGAYPTGGVPRAGGPGARASADRGPETRACGRWARC